MKIVNVILIMLMTVVTYEASSLSPEMGVYFLMLIIAVCFLFLRSESVFDKSS